MARVTKASSYPPKKARGPQKKKSIVKSAKAPVAAKTKAQVTMPNTKKAVPKAIAKKAKVVTKSVVKVPAKPSKTVKAAK